MKHKNTPRWACLMCSRGRTGWGRWQTHRTCPSGHVLRVRGEGQDEGGNPWGCRHGGRRVVMRCGCFTECGGEKRGAGIPANALWRVSMLLGWGCGRVVVSSSTCCDMVGLWKGGGCVVVVVFDASRVGLLTDPESCQCVMMCRHSLLNLLFRCGLVSSKTIK